MYPASFDYVAPTSSDEALSLLKEHGDRAKLLAGGQSLIPLLRIRLARPTLLVDLGRIDGLNAIEERDAYLKIGALVRHRDLAESDLIAKRYPAIASAAPQIADPLIRNLGTVGGSLAHADPDGDWGSVMLALGAEIVARSDIGERVIPMSEFFDGPFQSVLDPTEMLTEIRVPRPASRSGGAYLKLERKVGDFATVGVAVQLSLDNGTIGDAGIALTSVGPSNLLASDASDALKGEAPSDKAFREAGRRAAQAASPSSDVRGSADYKRDVVRVFVERGLEQALAIAKRGAS